MLIQLLEVPTQESPAWATVEAIAVLDEQRAYEGVFVTPAGVVLQLQLTASGRWIVRAWEPTH